jgi:hypothetical protein
LKSFIIRDAHDITIVMLEVMSTAVFTVARGTSSTWCGHSTDPILRRIYEENKAPNNITSDARNNHIPSLALKRPVSGRALIV